MAKRNDNRRRRAALEVELRRMFAELARTTPPHLLATFDLLDPRADSLASKSA